MSETMGPARFGRGKRLHHESYFSNAFSREYDGARLSPALAANSCYVIWQWRRVAKIIKIVNVKQMSVVVWPRGSVGSPGVRASGFGLHFDMGKYFIYRYFRASNFLTA